MSALTEALKTLRDTSMRLHAVADSCCDLSLALGMREKAREHERAVTVVEAHLKIVSPDRTQMEIH